MTDADFVKQPLAKQRRCEHSTARGSGDAPEEESESGAESYSQVGELVIEEAPSDVATELGQIRKDWTYDFQEDKQFYVHILGGKWKKAAKGVSYDGVVGYARKGLPSEWCLLFGFPRQASFMFNTYGRGVANELAREYCRRAQFLFQAVVLP